jgi:hypothetical protein
MTGVVCEVGTMTEYKCKDSAERALFLLTIN